MSRINQKYIVFLGVLVGLYFLLLFFMPQKFNWFISLYKKDKNPFGALVFKSLIDQSWFSEVNTSNQSLFELTDLEDPNLLVLCQDFKVTNSEVEALLNLVNEGKSVVISANQMDSIFTDTLGVKMNSLSFNFFVDKIWGEDSLGLRFIETPFDTSSTYWLPEQLLPQFFSSYDPQRTEVIAENTNGEPVLLSIRHGKGKLLLSSTPLMFTNFSILKSNNQVFIAGLLSILPAGSLHWTEYYQMGRMEARTPLRYVLGEPSLKWAFYTLMIAILLFMGFESKRTQRVIPVITPLKNETLDFVKTVSRLYYQKKDHKALAVKKMLHLTDYLKQHLQIDVNEDISIVISKLAAKTGSDVEEVKLLFDQMNHISNASYITANELKEFMERLRVVKDKPYK